MKVKAGREREFERAWHAVAEEACLIPGNLRQTLLHDPDDPSSFVITTEWESREAFTQFEVSPEQDRLTAPLRALRESAKQVTQEVIADVESTSMARASAGEEPTVLGAEPATPEGKGRVVFIIHLKPGMEQQFLQAYESMRYEVARGVKGHIVDQVCQSREDRGGWLITSEWDNLDDFLTWESTEGHRELARPLRECFAEARSLKYVVRKETSALPDAIGRLADGPRG